jgi:hypothetical protein
MPHGQLLHHLHSCAAAAALLQSLPGSSSKLNDPARQQQQHLQGFLTSLEASESVKKPKKLLASLLAYYSSLQKVGVHWWLEVFAGGTSGDAGIPLQPTSVFPQAFPMLEHMQQHATTLI